MTRQVPEWIGKTPDTPAPPRVKLRVFEKNGGICHLTGRKITPADQWDLDHITALVNGGENRESNLAPALRHAHKEKSAQDVAQKAKDRRVRSRLERIEKKRATIAGSKETKWKRKIDGTVVPR